MHVVVDTNVPKTASGHATHASHACIDATIQELARIMKRDTLVLDDADEIFGEYVRALGYAGTPGAGEKFVKWVSDHRYNAARCVRVRITPKTDPAGRTYAEIPTSPSLAEFDRDDHKFVAVSLVCGEPNEIVNALDSDWANFAAQLTAIGVKVRQLCAQAAPAARVRSRRR